MTEQPPFNPIRFVIVVGHHDVEGTTQDYYGPVATLEGARSKAREAAAEMKATPYAEAQENDSQWYSLDLDRHGSGSFDEYVYVRLAYADE